jgi:hypothetical protein
MFVRWNKKTNDFSLMLGKSHEVAKIKYFPGNDTYVGEIVSDIYGKKGTSFTAVNMQVMRAMIGDYVLRSCEDFELFHPESIKMIVSQAINTRMEEVSSFYQVHDGKKYWPYPMLFIKTVENGKVYKRIFHRDCRPVGIRPYATLTTISGEGYDRRERLKFYENDDAAKGSRKFSEAITRALNNAIGREGSKIQFGV